MSRMVTGAIGMIPYAGWLGALTTILCLPVFMAVVTPWLFLVAR